MGRRLRRWDEGVVYENTQACIDRQFQFVPNHHPQNQLLHKDCPLEALDPANDIVPIPSTINVIGSSIGRALEKHPITLHWFEASINHLHRGHSLTREQVGEPSEFYKHCNSLIATGMNRLHDREGHFFAGPARQTHCLDDESAEQQLFYALTNTVKDHLADKVSKAPFFSTFEHLATGKPLKFWYIDWEAYWEKGGPRNKKHREKDYLQWVEFEMAPLPGWQNLTESQRQTRVRKSVRDIEDICRQRRQAEEMPARSAKSLYSIDPRDRPDKPRRSGPQPLCHTKDKTSRRKFRDEWRAFVQAYKEASHDYRSGSWDITFPDGSIRPPIQTVVHNGLLGPSILSAQTSGGL